MSYSNRIFFYGPVGALLALVAAVCVWWWVEADRLEKQLDAVNGHEVAPGIVFAFAEKSLGGFPFRIDLVLSGVTLSERGPMGETAWRGEKLAIHAQTYDLNQFIFEAAGLQSIALPGAPPRVTYLNAAIARASAILRNGRLVRFDLDLWQPQAKDASLGADITRTFAAERAQLHFLERADDTIAVAARVDGAHIGAGFKPPFAPDIALLDLRGVLNHARALDPLLAGQASVAPTTEGWRVGGGSFTVQSLALDWAGVKTTMTGTLGLDEAHMVAGAVSGPFDAGVLMKALTHGALNLTASGTSILTLTFKDGSMLIGAGAPPAPAPTP